MIEFEQVVLGGYTSDGRAFWDGNKCLVPTSMYWKSFTIKVYITAPLYWWTDWCNLDLQDIQMFEARKLDNPKEPNMLTIDNFSHEHLDHLSLKLFEDIICKLNANRGEFYEYLEKDNSINSKKDYWWQVVQLLPASYNQRRCVVLSYESLHTIYHQMAKSPLDEWAAFCQWVESLPHSRYITKEM